ncbi:hypothetical protein [Mycobacteroides chelonae]|uniref:hypothetical protein n=1 Tax=Mycobacteroides chelonae TaxID=1774 RepID=UPI0013F4E7E4|nr:hypothetical protein [Mycobacteroides chelonae]
MEQPRGVGREDIQAEALDAQRDGVQPERVLTAPEKHVDVDQHRPRRIDPPQRRQAGPTPERFAHLF